MIAHTKGHIIINFNHIWKDSYFYFYFFFFFFFLRHSLTHPARIMRPRRAKRGQDGFIQACGEGLCLGSPCGAHEGYTSGLSMGFQETWCEQPIWDPHGFKKMFFYGFPTGAPHWLPIRAWSWYLSFNPIKCWCLIMSFFFWGVHNEQ